MQASINSLPGKQQGQVLALRRYIAVFAAIIFAAGLTLLGLSFYKGAPNFTMTSIGAILMALGTFGIYAGLTLNLNATKVYVIAIFVSLVATVILLGLELNFLNGWVNAACHRKNFTALICAQYRHFRWVLAVVCFVVALPACCSCLFCAYSYQIALQPPRGRGYEYFGGTGSAEAPEDDGANTSPTKPLTDHTSDL